MKKLLTILNLFTVTTVTVSTVVACGNSKVKTAAQPNPSSPKDLTAQQKANEIASDLDSLSAINIEISDDEKTVDDVKRKIKNAQKVKDIISRYKATIVNSSLTLELSDGSNFDKSKIKNGAVLKVLGDVKVDSATADFELGKVILKVTDANEVHKQEANKAASDLDSLSAITIKISDNEKTVDEVKRKIKNAQEITEVISKYNATIVSSSLTLELSDGSNFDNSKVKNGAVLKVSGDVKVGTSTAAFELKKVILKVTDANEVHKQEANKAASELDSLSAITVKISDDEKTVDDVKRKIKNAQKVKDIISRYKATIVNSSLTLELSDGSNFDKSKIKDGAVLKVSGDIKVGTSTAAFELEKVILKVTDANEAHRQEANKAVNKLMNFPSIDIKTSDLGETHKADNLNKKLLENSEIKEIIDGINITLMDNKFTLKVDSAYANDVNLVDKVVVKVSGKIIVKGQESNKSFSFNAYLDEKTYNLYNSIANQKTVSLSKLTDIIIKISDLGEINKADELNKILLNNRKIKDIIGNEKLKDNKFILKVGDKPADDSNLVTGNTVKVSGKIQVVRLVSNTEFNFTIKLAEKTDKEIANEAAEKLSKLTNITIKPSKFEQINKADELNTKLRALPAIKSIMKENVKLQDDKFTFKVAGDDADDINLVDKAVVSVSCRVKVNAEVQDRHITSFDIDLRNIPLTDQQRLANKKAEALSKLSCIIIKPSELETIDKVKALHDKLLSHKRIKKIIDGNDVTLANKKFVFKVNNTVVIDGDILVDKAVVSVSGKIEVNGQESEKEFALKVKLEESDANIAVSKLLKKLNTLITFESSKLSATNRTHDLNIKLLNHPDIKSIIDGTVVRLEDVEFTFKVGNDDANDTNLVMGTPVTVFGKIKVNGQKSSEKFIFYLFIK